jgi:hypothetical protein
LLPGMVAKPLFSIRLPFIATGLHQHVRLHHGVGLRPETLDTDRHKGCDHGLSRGDGAVFRGCASGYPAAPGEADNGEADGANDGALNPGFDWHIHGISLPWPIGGPPSAAGNGVHGALS